MSLYSEWLDLAEDVLNKAGVGKDGVNDYDLQRSPIYFSNPNGNQYPSIGSHFLNIIPYDEALLNDEFSTNSQAAVVFSSEDFNSVKGVSKIFFQPSMTISPSHNKALFQKEIPVDLGLDPYSLGLWKGELGQMDSEVLSKLETSREGLKVFRLSSLAYNLSGATPQQQLAILLASTHQLIRDYESFWSVEEILSKVSFELALGPHIFINMASLKAYRLLMNRFCEALKVTDQKIEMYATPSPRYLATREPWNNILRLTAMSFASRAGGANGFFSWPYDLLSQKVGTRVSRNTLLMLEEESFVGKVQYPAAGSGLNEDLVNQLCQKAWTFFQEIENKGGLLKVLRSGWLQSEIALESEKEVRRFNSREMKMIGVNEFALTKAISEDSPLVSPEEKIDISQWWIDYTKDSSKVKLSDVQKLKPYQLSENFERWQYKADRYRKEKGESLKVSLYCEDPKSMKAKLSSSRRLMEMAGLEIELFKEGGAVHPVALFISADPEGAVVTEALEKMKSKGCKYSLWVGDREQKFFDSFVGEKSPLMSVYENIFQELGGLS